jgi:hypothetical protein
VIPYYVFLKSKRGEYRALADLDPLTRAEVTPVIELLEPPPPREKAGRPTNPPLSIDEQIALHVRDIGLASGTCHRVLLDFTKLPPGATSDKRHPVEVILKRLVEKGVQAAPVVQPSITSMAQLTAIKASGALDHGLVLRMSLVDFDLPAEHLDVIMSSLGVTAPQIDAIIDFGDIDDASALRRGMMSAATVRQRADRDWRSISIGAASFPKSLTSFGEGKFTFERHEWKAWAHVAAAHDSIGFADYGIRNVPPPVTGGGTSPVPNVRYTRDESWHVYRAKAVDSSFYPEVAYQLVRDNEVWMGAAHCAGCRQLEALAAGGKGQNAEYTIRYGMTHHITYVTRQLAKLNADGAAP